MENSSMKNEWYNKTWLVIVLCIVFFPVGLYALWKNQSISRGWKITATVVIALIVINLGREEKTNISDSSTPTSTEVSRGSDTSKSRSSTSYASEAKQSSTKIEIDNKPEYKKIGDEVTVGKFAYRVNNIQFVKSIGNDFFRRESDGVYLIVDLSLVNISNEAETINNSLFKLTDASGTEFEISTEGGTALEMIGKESLFLKKCNPKIQKRGFLVFEVPKAGVYDLHLSGGFWSGKEDIVKLTRK